MKARSRFAIITTTLAALTISAVAFAADWKFPSGGTVEFSCPKGSETLSISISGTTNNVSIKDDGGKVTIVTKLDCDGKSCLKTGIGVRDEHLYEHIEAGKHKTATLVIDKSKLKPPGDGTVSGEVPAELTFHGKTKTVTVKYTVKGGEATGTTHFKLTDFGLDKAKKMGVSTGSEVDVTTKFKVSAS
jgi:polyisoprenoid-binding protein YceI